MKQPNNTYLAEFNIARLIAPKEDPRVAGFMNAIDQINGLGSRMSGFVWLMQGDMTLTMDSSSSNPEENTRLIPNLTVWQDAASLENFVFNTVHKQFFERRAEWFEILGKMHFVMWWVAKGHRPTKIEAMERLEYLRKNGESDHAFGWKYLKETNILQSNDSIKAAE